MQKRTVQLRRNATGMTAQCTVLECKSKYWFLTLLKKFSPLKYFFCDYLKKNSREKLLSLKAVTSILGKKLQLREMCFEKNASTVC